MDTTVSAILSGDLPASAALRRPDLYDSLNAGKSRSTGMRLPFLGTSGKIEAGASVDVLGTVLYMQPAKVSGREACAGRSAGCTAACLAESVGRMSSTAAQQARRRRHASFFADRSRFLRDLVSEIALHERRALKLGKTPAVRLNGTTDLPWHRMPVTIDGVTYPNVHALFPNVKFYEYTKLPYAMQAKGGIPSNLHFTFSMSDKPGSDAHALDYLSRGHGVAVVTFTNKGEAPEHFTIEGHTFPTVDGDKHDARFLDPAGHVTILSAKGRAKRDTTGFVRFPTNLPLALAA